MLRDHLGKPNRWTVFETRNGTPLETHNVVRQMLKPLCKTLGDRGWRDARLPARSREPFAGRTVFQPTSQRARWDIRACGQQAAILTFLRRSPAKQLKYWRMNCHLGLTRGSWTQLQSRLISCSLRKLQRARVEFGRAVSSAVRASGLHPEGPAFKSLTAHHPAVHYRGDVVQLVRTLPCHGRGREFESRRPRHSPSELPNVTPETPTHSCCRFNRV